MIITKANLYELRAMDHKAGVVFLMDKPLTWTSFNVVAKVRGVLSRFNTVKRFKVGHTGTLDPLASGLLILCAGKATKRITEFMDQQKEYTGTITLGATRPSFDMETEIEAEFPFDHITEAQVEEAMKTFIGEILQRPPIYSAKQIQGKRAYDLARAGKEVKVPKAMVEVATFELTAFRLPEIDFRVVCSKGTYIRSLANDIGQSLNSGAYLSALRRTASGEYNVEDALSIADVQEALKLESV